MISVRSITAGIVLTALLVASPARAGCVMQSWSSILAPGPQTAEKIETFKIGKSQVAAVKFDKVAGNFGKVFLFLRHDGNCITDAVSFGSYEATTKVARELGSIGPQDRRYHVDYYAAKVHSTIGFLASVPDYREARKTAKKVFRKFQVR